MSSSATAPMYLVFGQSSGLSMIAYRVLALSPGAYSVVQVSCAREWNRCHLNLDITSRLLKRDN